MRVSGYQLFWLISVSSILGMSYLPIRFAVAEAKQDAWIAMLLAGLLMIGITWFMLRICRRHEQLTLVQFAQALMGKAIGKLIIALYIVSWFLQMATIMRDMANFQNLVTLHRTPMIVIVACMVFLIAYSVHRGGLTAISRCSEIIGPVFVFILFFQLLLNPQDMDFKRILPIYADTGWMAILRGVIGCYPYLIDPSLILILFFFAKNKRSAVRATLWATTVAMFYGMLTTFVLLFVTGPDLAARLVFPVYSLTKFVVILNFVQNFEAFFLLVWLLGAFIKLSLSLFIVSYALSECMGLRSWKSISWILGVVLFIFVVYYARDYRLANILKSDYNRYILYPLLYGFFPLLLWTVGRIRNRPT